MRITLRTSGIVAEHLPAGGDEDGVEIEVAEGATPLEVMRRFGLPLEESYLVALNGTVVPSAERPLCTLAEGDELVIMPPLRGGSTAR